MARIYVASSWRNERHPSIVLALVAAGHEVYDFRNPPGRTGFSWAEIDPAWASWDPETYRRALNHPVALAGFGSDHAAMEWADTFVLVLPCGRSAHLEAGWAAGSGRSLHILMEVPQEPELMYLEATSICLSLDELLGRLAQPPPARIEVAQLDPHTLVGLAEANDGSGGWVVMEACGDGDRTPYTVTPVRDGYGEIVYADIQDAVNVLRTGQVWRHDMGEGESDEEGTP